MKDISNAAIFCEKCNTKAQKAHINKEGFPIRIWKCGSCNQSWFHPSDAHDYEQYKRIRDKTFKVKLRLVGNSYTVSIPREIIEFQEEMERDMDNMIQLALEGPEKLGLFFSRRRLL